MISVTLGHPIRDTVCVCVCVCGTLCTYALVCLFHSVVSVSNANEEARRGAMVLKGDDERSALLSRTLHVRHTRSLCLYTANQHVSSAGPRGTVDADCQHEKRVLSGDLR